MIPLNVNHLLDPDEIPDGFPRIAEPISKKETIIQGDGIAIQEVNGDYIVSISDSVIQDAIQAAAQPPQDDPLAGMGYRVLYSDGIASINRGYILHSYYFEIAWKNAETLVPYGELALNNPSPKCSVYIAIKIDTFAGEDNSPWNEYDSAPYIDGNYYLSHITLRTEYTGLNAAQFSSPGEASLFEVYYEDFPSFPVDGKIRIHLADIDEDGVVNQSHMGLITLPQSYETKVQAWDFR